MKNKIVKKGERKSMKKRKYLALLLAAGMIAQTALSTGGVVQVQAAEDTYVKTDELTDNDTAAPKKDSVIPSKNQYEYQKQELAAFCHFGPNTFNEIEWGEHYGDKTPNEIFKLTEDFDADTLVKTLKEAVIRRALLRRGELTQVQADRQAQEAVNLPHPVGVTAGQVFVDGDDVYAAAVQRVQIDRQYGG